MPENDRIVKNEVDSMIKSLPDFQKSVTNYAFHRLRVNI